MNDKMKLCPFCDIDKLRLLRDSSGNIAFVNCAEHTIPMSPERWQSRPIEDALRKQLDVAVEAMKEVRLNINSGMSALFSKEVMYTSDAMFYINRSIELATNALAEIAKIGGANVSHD